MFVRSFLVLRDLPDNIHSKPDIYIYILLLFIYIHHTLHYKVWQTKKHIYPTKVDPVHKLIDSTALISDFTPLLLPRPFGFRTFYQLTKPEDSHGNPQAFGFRNATLAVENCAKFHCSIVHLHKSKNFLKGMTIFNGLELTSMQVCPKI